jgi:hypothetical protein
MTGAIRFPATVERYINGGIHTVDGWFSPTDARLLALIGGWQQANDIRGDICEIGVYHGRCLVLLGLLLRPGETAFGVDLFSRDIGDEYITRTNLAQFCNGQRSQLINKNSLELTAADLRCDGSSATGIRLFCVDGGHAREIAAHDFRFAETVLAKGGVVVVDDFFNRNWPGVAEGIHRVFCARESGLLPFAIGQAKVFFTEHAFADLYREAITCNWPQGVANAELFDAPVAVVRSQSSRLSAIVRAVRKSVRRLLCLPWLASLMGADEGLAVASRVLLSTV